MDTTIEVAGLRSDTATSVADLLASASGDRVMLRTETHTQAAAVLVNTGAEADVTGPGRLTIAGLPAERVAAS